MSRLARKPLQIPSGVEFKYNENILNIKGPKGEFKHKLHPSIDLDIQGNQVTLSLKKGFEQDKAMLGTTFQNVKNQVIGVSNGFEKKLILKGVGYRAKAQGKVLELTLGFSHPVKYTTAYDGITIETPSNTEIIVKGYNKQNVGQVASEIRAFRPREPYKGKGVLNEKDLERKLKETKKK